MLQNRVNPYGAIISTAARGSWLGNRGVIHNEHRQVVKPYNLPAWIICRLEFRGRYRKVMTPDRWTELFFFDEATAFAAGHRPCFQCRYQAHVQFKKCWLLGNPEYGFTDKTPISEIDNILHIERLNKGTKVTFIADGASLPNGTFIEAAGEPYLVANGTMHKWTPFGYCSHVPIPPGSVTVLTPQSTVNAFKAGYKPQMGK